MNEKKTIEDFLTNLPEISYFKQDYQRYTKFSLYSYVQDFKGNNLFGENLQCTIEKIGDLINKMYLKITLPKIKIYKNNEDVLNDKNNIQLLNNNLTQIKNDYSVSKSFYIIVYQAINIIKKQLLLKFNLNIIVMKINSILTSTNKQTYDSIQNTNLYNQRLIKFDLFTIFLSNEINNFIDVNNDNNTLTFINIYLGNILKYMKDDNTFYLDKITNINKQIEFYSKNTYDVKWIDNIGQYIIENYIINIGGINITSYDSDYLNIYNDLYKNENMKDLYESMIGNKINYSNNQDIVLYIPLIFWFNREYSQSLPCIGMRNSDINISIKINDIEKCVLYDKTKNIINEIKQIKIKNISLYIDNIFLSENERIYFGQNQHSYIIEDVQINKYKIELKQDYSFKLDFSSNVRELYWIVKNSSNLDLFNSIDINIGNHIFQIGNKIIISNTLNYNGSYIIKDITNVSIIIYSKFIINESGIIQLDTSCSLINNNNHYLNTLSKCNIIFNGIERNKIIDSFYYNTIQPYQYHNSTIQSGLNIYNFGLYTETFQPSGTFNFSDKMDQTLNISLTDIFYNYSNIRNDYLIVKIYANSFKIIKFTNGTIQIIL